MPFSRLIHNQFFYRPPILLPSDFTNKTVIVTGGNSGLGIEAVKHFVRLNAAKVIGTVRSKAKAHSALKEVEEDTKLGVAEFWQLDYESYGSVKQFCEKVALLDRVDAVILNAGTGIQKYTVCHELEETCVVVNVISTTLLMLLLLPILKGSARKFEIVPRLCVTGSASHSSARFRERKATKSFEALSSTKTKSMCERYRTTKLLQLLAVREIASRTATSDPFVIINTVHPGLCKTGIFRRNAGLTRWVNNYAATWLGWSSEEGSRTLVHGVIVGPESHGIMLSECKVENNVTAPWLSTDEGKKVQKKVWKELSEKLEKIQPGVTSNIESAPGSGLIPLGNISTLSLNANN